MLLIARKELQALFSLPLGWILLAISQFLLTYLALIHLQDFVLLEDKLKLMDNPPGISQYLIPRFYAPLSTLYLLFIPLLAMRMLAEEKRQHTLVLFFASPIGLQWVFLGKWLALVIYFTLMLLCNSAIFILLGWYVALDWPVLLWCLFGCILFVAACSAISLYFSALARQGSTAVLGAYGFFFALWMISLSAGTQQQTDELIRYISLSGHLDSFLLGLVSRQDIVYFVLLVFLFSLLAIVHLLQMRKP